MDVKDDCFKYKSYFFNFLIILGCKNKDFVQLSGNGLNSNAEIWLSFILLRLFAHTFCYNHMHGDNTHCGHCIIAIKGRLITSMSLSV